MIFCFHILDAILEDDESQWEKSPKMKEKSLLQRIRPFRRRKQSTTTSPVLVWKVGREELVRQKQQSQTVLTSPGRIEVDANLGKYNPRLVLQLYPGGVFEDEGKAVTMAMRIIISEKCPPLPPTAVVHITLDVENDKGKKRLNLHENLSTSIFYVYEVITHVDLAETKCKQFVFEVKATCTGL